MVSLYRVDFDRDKIRQDIMASSSKVTLVSFSSGVVFYIETSSALDDVEKAAINTIVKSAWPVVMYEP